jgi:hypothetical protein
MQTDLFPTDRHDAGGRVKSALPSGLKGDAVFYGERDEYRPLLRRWIGDEFPSRYVLFVGMNPSVAEAQIQDPTIVREWGFASRWGYDGYVKCNIADYRATFPKDLLVPGITPSSTVNLPTIFYQALAADLVVICHGKLNRVLEPIGREVVSNLRDLGIELKCLGKTKDGFPRHPLYLRSDTPLMDY